MERNDCDAQVLSHTRVTGGGRDGGPCEMVTVRTGRGTRAELVYRLSPLELIDELKASVWYWSGRAGARLSLRVRYPLALDPSTGEPAAVLVGNADYQQRSQWQLLSVSGLRSHLTYQQAVLRNRLGRDVDLRQAYVDAVVVNAYTGAGIETIRFDDLRVDHAVAVGDNRLLGEQTATAGNEVDRVRDAFPVGVVKRIIQYNGESMDWLRDAGFTGVFLTRVPSADLLRSASESGLEVIAPRETVSRRELIALLEPVVAWNMGDALLDKDIASEINVSGHMRRLPGTMRRQLVGFPVESNRQYRSILDFIAIDVPPPVRGLSASEEVAIVDEAINVASQDPQWLAAIASGPSEKLREQLDQLAHVLGVSPVQDYGWHATWLQAMRSLESSPRAVVYRSGRALDSGRAEDMQRTGALRFINRWITLLQPIVSTGAAVGGIDTLDSDYRAELLRNGNVGLILATSTASVGTMPSSGHGQVLRMLVPPSIRGQQIFRVTNMKLERMQIEDSPAGTSISVVSPDFVELLLVANDMRVLTQFERQLQRSASALGYDRYQLVMDSLQHTSADWQQVMQSDLASPGDRTGEYVMRANEALRESGVARQAGDVASSYRMLRRADAWNVAAIERLVGMLALPNPVTTSHPALCAPNSASLLINLMARTDQGNWRRDTSLLDPFKNPRLWTGSAWSHDRRREDLAKLDVQVVSIDQLGNTALQLRAQSLNGQPLPGGYAGTVLRARSPEIPARQGELLQIDAEVRVSSPGVARAHRGALVYDTYGGPEIGQFVRPLNDAWQSVRLFRTVTDERPLQVTFELIGEGTVEIKSLSLNRWVPRSERLPFRPLIGQSPGSIVQEPPAQAFSR